MSDPVALVYLETDDEVTSVVRRIRATDAERIVLVAPGRSRATSGVVSMRLLARAAGESGRELSLVGDSLTRSLAVEAGLLAWASVEDARNAAPIPVDVPAVRAPIRVVRGEPGDENETGIRPVTTPPSDADATMAVPTPRAPASAAPRDRSRPLRVGRAAAPALLIALGVLLLGVGVAAAFVLPAATVTLTPSTVPLGPIHYELRIENSDRVDGSVDGTATVTASGTYPIQGPATGVVVFRNFNTVDVAVAAGALVAAGDQAFETTADVVVPAGALTAEGTIRAGEEAADVQASAIGPDANVDPNAIDTILSQAVTARLRGFPNNAQRLVLNPEPTTGGIDDVGPEFTQADVDEARGALVAELEAAVADRLGSTGDAVVAGGAAPPEPVVDGLEGVVGTRDSATAELRGTLAYDRVTADRSDVIERAASELKADPSAVPGGHELIASSIDVTIGEARADGDVLVVGVQVTAAATSAVDRDAVVEMIRGRPLDEARAALDAIGGATLELWPGWADRVPDLDWRIDVLLNGEQTAPSASATP